MTERNSNVELSGDDPMLDQIQAATTANRESVNESKSVPLGDPLEPGEPESARFEPDASQ